MTKIDIYSGFLGAGKTTLNKKMIKEAYHGQKLVLIENEFGEIGIDGGFLQEAEMCIRDRHTSGSGGSRGQSGAHRLMCRFQCFDLSTMIVHLQNAEKPGLLKRNPGSLRILHCLLHGLALTLY